VRANVRFGLTDNNALGSPVSETAAGQSNGMVEAETTRDLLGKKSAMILNHKLKVIAASKTGFLPVFVRFLKHKLFSIC